MKSLRCDFPKKQCLISQSVKQVWTRSFICQSVKSNVFGPSVEVWDVKRAQKKSQYEEKAFDLLKKSF